MVQFQSSNLIGNLCMLQDTNSRLVPNCSALNSLCTNTGLCLWVHMRVMYVRSLGKFLMPVDCSCSACISYVCVLHP